MYYRVDGGDYGEPDGPSPGGWWIVVMIVAVLLFAWIVSPEAEASDLNVICCTYHNDSEADFNDFNPGLLYRFGETNTKGVVGAYYNSERSPSFMLGAAHDYRFNDVFTGSVGVGVVSGYGGATLRPYIMPTLIIKDRVGLTLIPTSWDGNIDFAVNMTIRIWE